MNFKEEYRQYNETVRTDKALMREMKEEAREWGALKRQTARYVVRRTVTAAAACLCICVAMPVLAANVDPVYEVLYLVAPKLAQSFRLVKKSAEYQGIRMEVGAAYLEGDEIKVYVTMQDLEGDRIDETTDLIDSYSINTPFPGYGGCQSAGYDEETHTASFLVTLGQLPDEATGADRDIKGEKITFSVRKFISHQKEYEHYDVPIPLTDAEMNPKSMVVHLSGGTGSSVWKRVDMNDDDPRPGARVLVPGEADQRFPIDGIEVTGMGYVDGMLHIQTAVRDALTNNNHGHFMLVDQEGNERLYDCKLSFSQEDSEGRRVHYEDCIFEVSPEELSNYTLRGYFVTSGFWMEGRWTVTFPLE